MRSLWICLLLTAFILAGGSGAQSLIGPIFVNNTATIDSNWDNQVCIVADSRGIFHAVWVSLEPMLGSGTDSDIFYSQYTNSAWSTPELVNTNGTIDGSTTTDATPKLAVGPDGTLHCVWVTDEPFAGSGNDQDVLYARRTAAGWSAPELVGGSYAVTDGGLDLGPGIAVSGAGVVYVAWSSNEPLSTLGPDNDILQSVRTGSTWSTVAAIDPNMATDTGDDIGPVAMTTGENGVLFAAWSSSEPNLGSGLPGSMGNDYDIVWSNLSPPGNWSFPLEACIEMRGDTGDDFFPTVASVGSGETLRRHVAWRTTSGAWGNGNDSDIVEAYWGNIFILPVSIHGNLVNRYALTDALTDNDDFPQLFVEPGGVVHCLWESSHNDLFGTDWDIYHATSGTNGAAWSAPLLANLNGLIDPAASTDSRVSVARAPNGVIGAAWESDNDVLGAGTDWDIFGAAGTGRRVSIPHPINSTASSDTSGPASDFDFDGDIVLTSTGAVHAVWSSNYTGLSGAAGDFDIFHASLAPDGTVWTNPDLVNSYGNADGATDDDTSPRILIDSNGALHVVWISSYNLGASAGTDADLFYSSNSGPGWTAPTLVNSTGTTDGINAYDVNHTLAIGPSDEIHVAWVFNADPIGLGDDDIFYTVNSGSGWSAAEMVNSSYGITDTGNDRNPDIAVDGNGEAHLVWDSKSNFTGQGTDAEVVYSIRTGGAWSAPQFVNTYAFTDGAEDVLPAIGVTSDATPHVVWTSDLDVNGSGIDGDIWTSSRIGGSWNTATLFNTTGTLDGATDFDSFADVAVDDLGILHVAWESTHNLGLTAGTDFDIFYSYALSPGTVSPEIQDPILANTSGYDDSPVIGDDRYPILRVASDGIVHFAWTSDSNIFNPPLGVDQDFLHASLDRVYVTSPMVIDHLQDRFPLRGWDLWRADANSDGLVDAADVVTLVNAGR